jgi:hypothetical protein
MPNPFKPATDAAKSIETSETAFSAIAVKPQKLTVIGQFLENRAIGKTQREISARRVRANADVQIAQVNAVRDQAIAAVTAAAVLKGINTRAAIVAQEAAALGGLQTALTVQKASIASELAGARLASAMGNIDDRKARQNIILAKFNKGELTSDEADCMLELINGLHGQVEDAVDRSYEGGREVLNQSFDLATKTAAEVAQKFN